MMKNRAMTLLPFLHPVHFMFRGRKSAWPEFFDGSALPPTDLLAHRIIEVEECWIAQTYLQLLQRGLKVTVSDHFREDAINVVSYHDLAIRDFPINFYIVAVQHDAARPAICQQRVVQNELNVLNSDDYYIPHWPQPGLKSRDPQRGATIQNICFKGSECNFYPPFKSKDFLNELARLGVELQYDVKENTDRQSINWYDYRHCDLVLAVRDATEEDLKIKPASKLVNAWLAGCPALLGPEPAYQALRKNPLDYFEVRTPDDVLNVVNKLKQNPELYEAMVKNGFSRGVEYTAENIAKNWHHFLNGPAVTKFVEWQSGPRLLKIPKRWAAFLFNTLQHKYNLHRYYQKRDHGFRPISNTAT